MKHDIVNAIDAERLYQDAKWGSPQQRPHTLMEWLTIMRGELREAEDAWLTPGPLTDAEVLCELLQVVAVGVAAMEQHGTMGRARLQKLRDAVDDETLMEDHSSGIYS